MKIIHFLCALLPFILWDSYTLNFSPLSPKNEVSNPKIKGMTVVTAQQSITTNTIQSLQELGVNTITLLPFGFVKGKSPEISFESVCRFPDCPFGEHTHTVLKASIDSAHSAGLQVVIKPHIWSFSQWSSELNFKKEADWKLFENDYYDFIMTWVDIAIEKKVGLFCIGSELHNFVDKRSIFWQKLIKDIRAKYTGKLTYGANWNNYQQNDLWEQLDYIGINTYFPLSSDTTPSIDVLKEQWQPIVHQLDSFSKAQDKPILFTEWGYLSVDACANRHWEIKISKVKPNQQAQANSIEALLTLFSEKEWWAGGLQWKWYNDSISTICEYRPGKDYTPQGKLAEKVLQKIYK